MVSNKWEAEYSFGEVLEIFGVVGNFVVRGGETVELYWRIICYKIVFKIVFFPLESSKDQSKETESF